MRRHAAPTSAAHMPASIMHTASSPYPHVLCACASSLQAFITRKILSDHLPSCTCTVEPHQFTLYLAKILNGRATPLHYYLVQRCAENWNALLYCGSPTFDHTAFSTCRPGTLHSSQSIPALPPDNIRSGHYARERSAMVATQRMMQVTAACCMPAGSRTPDRPLTQTSR